MLQPRQTKSVKACALQWHLGAVFSRLQRLRYVPGMTLVTVHWPLVLCVQKRHSKLLKKHPKNAVVRPCRCHIWMQSMVKRSPSHTRAVQAQ